MKASLRWISGYLLGFVLFIVLIPWGFYGLSAIDPVIPLQIPQYADVLRWIVSLALLLNGLFFAAWSNRYLLIRGEGGPTDAFGVAVCPRTKKLVTTGPYKFCRNPMVFGALSIYTAIVVYLHTITGLAALLLLYFLAVLFLRFSEEKRLVRDFGETFLEYRKKVPMILPLGFLLCRRRS